MADQKTKDLAIDYALGLVDPDQLELVRRRLEEDGAVWDEVAELEEIAADLTLLAPQVSPDSSLCQSVMDRIDAISDGSDADPESSQHHAVVPILGAAAGRKRRIFSYAGWAIAACLAIAVTVLALRNQEYRDAIVNLRSGEGDSGEKRPGRSGSKEIADGAVSPAGRDGNNTEPPLQPNLEDGSQDTLLNEGHRGAPYPIASGGKRGYYQLQQDLDALKQRVSDLKRVREERFQAVPGLARLTVIEMRSKRQGEEADDSNGSEEDKSGDGSAKTGLIGQIETSDPLVASIDDPSPSISDVLADGLLDSGLIALSPDPAPDDFDGMFADADIDIGRDVAMPTPPGAEDGDAAGEPEEERAVVNEVPTDNEVPAGDQVTTDQPPVPDPPVEAVDPQIADIGVPEPPGVIDPIPSIESANAQTSAFTIYDETTGQGSILVQNLPAPELGLHYQLWMVDSLDAQPMNVGSLPDLETGDGRIFFELGEAGYSPSEFFITKEGETGSAAPTGDPFLFGPDLSGQSDGSRIGISPQP